MTRIEAGAGEAGLLFAHCLFMQASCELAAGTAPHTDAKRMDHQPLGSNSCTSLGRGVDVLIKTLNCNLVGVIQDVGPDALSIAMMQPLAEGSAISIEFGAEIRAGEIISCRRKGTRYEACVVIPNKNAADRRCAQRFPITQEVQVQADSLEAQMDAVIVDLSAGGMALDIAAQLRIGEIVTVESAASLAFGIVRHCATLRGGRFRAGVETFHIMPKDEEARHLPNISVVERLFSFHQSSFL